MRQLFVLLGCCLFVFCFVFGALANETKPTGETSDDDDLGLKIEEGAEAIKNYFRTHPTKGWKKDLVDPALAVLKEANESEEYISGIRKKFDLFIKRKEEKIARKAKVASRQRAKHEEL